jgi:glutamine cyclotransferase
VWANIWHSDCIAQIDPASGDVLGWVLLGGLRMRAEEAAAADAAASNTPFTRLDHEAVLNGIAYDAEQRRLFVTGKLWPRVYQVELEEVAEADHAAAVQGARQQCLKRRIGLR